MEILDQIKQLKEDAINGCVKYTQQGICDNIKYRINYDYFKSWTGFSGKTNFPVFDKLDLDNTTPEDQFMGIENLWQGRQLELRLSLIDHLIKCYEAESK